MADNELKDDVKDAVGANDEPATSHDVGIGGGLGAVGGAIVGGLAGGPIGAIIGAIAGGAASAGAVDVVDKHDNDYAETVSDTDTSRVAADPLFPTAAGGDTTVGTASGYTGPGDYARTQATVPVDETLVGARDTTNLDTDTDQRIRLHEEQLNVDKQAVQAGEVTLHKEVVTETKSIDVPVTREEVVIDRHAVAPGEVSATGADLDTAQDQVIRVPVMEEQVTVEKTPVVTEEVSLGKREVTETQHVTDTVRREEAHIENPQNVDVLDRTRNNP